MTVDFDRTIEAIEAQNLAFLEQYETGGGSPASRLSTAIAPDQLSVVVIIRDPESDGPPWVLNSASFEDPAALVEALEPFAERDAGAA